MLRSVLRVSALASLRGFVGSLSRAVWPKVKAFLEQYRSVAVVQTD